MFRFKKILKVIGNIGKGVGKAVIHDILPVPDLKEIGSKYKRKEVAEKIRETGSLGPGYTIADLLDDGKINQSVDEALIENITRMITSSAGLVAIIIYILLELI